MIGKFKYWFVLLLFAGSLMQGGAQTVESLKKQRKEIEERLKETDKLLKQKKKDEKSSLNRINVLRKNLNERKNLIKNFSSEINYLDNNIGKLTDEKAELERKLVNHKSDYAKLIRKTQSNHHSYSKLMFLLSAENFNQSLRRARYLGEFSDYKKVQVKQIERLKTEIIQKTDSLNRNKLTKNELLKSKEAEAAKIQNDEKAERLLLVGLKNEERKLLAEYKSHQLKREQIDRKIQQVIEDEIRKAEARRKLEEQRQKAAEEARRKAETEARRKLEEKRLADARIAEQKAADKRAAEQRAAEQRAKTTAQSNKKTDTEKQTEVAKPAESTVAVVTPSKTVETPKELATATPKASQEYAYISREAQLLGGSFAANKGRLPWPVERGAISGHFGRQPHPDLKYVEINNKGTYFRAPAGTNARAVFAGEVAKIFSLPGSGNAVIIQHGNYRTVYANLSSIYVREGDRVTAKQSIGKIFTDDQSGQAELQFQIYNDRNLTNPESWIAR